MNLAARLALLLSLSAGPTSAADAPHWIWGAENAYPAYRFQREIDLDGAVTRAAVRIAGDFCRTRLIVNGREALVVAPYCQAQDIDVTALVQRGANALAVIAEPVPGPPAVALSFVAEFQDGRRVEVVSDSSWHVVTPDLPAVVDLGVVRPELWGVGRRPVVVSPFENYEQWKQTLDKGTSPQTKFDVAPGFTVTTVHNAAEDEGSWIALAFDDAGRLTISREDQGLLRMTLADDRKSVTRVEPIDVDLKECRGLVYDHGWLYANANTSKAMYRLKLDDAGKVRNLTVLRDFPGEGGHGRNDLAFGPRGELYSIHGDAVRAPGVPIIDRTSPLRESRQGEPRKEAYLLRTDRRGLDWELVCTGLRNPYGVAVAPNGDAFTYDADNEFDMGTPWYRPTRIVQLLSGADYGYRSAGGQWPPNYPDHPDNGLPLIDVGRGSPTAAMFGTNLKFPPDYQAAMFALDWSYGRVLAVHLAPRGGGYRAALEVFLQGRPLNVTDVAAGPDGAMYLITGGRKTQSALYRVEYTGKPQPSPSAESQHEQDCAAFAEVQRTVRRKLEKFHGAPNMATLDTAWKYLSDADPTVRHAARIALEQLPVAMWEERADAPTDDWRAKLAVWTALSRTPDDDRAMRLSAEAPAVRISATNDDSDLDERFEQLDNLGRWFAQLPETARDRSRWHPESVLGAIDDARGSPRRVGIYGDGEEYVRRAVLYLSKLGAKEAVAAAAPLLDDPRQENRLQALLALRNQKTGWTPDVRRRYFETLRDASRFVGGQGMPTFIEKLKTDAVATLSEAERKKYAALLEPVKVVDEPLPPPRDKVREWTLDALVDACAQGGDAGRGAAVFRDALCSRCHRAGLVGPAVGPDLTFVARRFSRRDMLESIVRPSLAVAEQYRNAQVVTADGRVLTGRVVTEGDFRTEKLVLNVDPLHPSRFVELDKKEIDEYRLTDTSPMPQGLLDSFTLAEIRDLLAFLESGPDAATAESARAAP